MAISERSNCFYVQQYSSRVPLFALLVLGLGWFVAGTSAPAVAADPSDAKDELIFGVIMISGMKLSPNALRQADFIRIDGTSLPGKEGSYGSDQDLDQLKHASQLTGIFIPLLQSNPDYEITAKGLENFVGLKRLRRVQYIGMRKSNEKLDVLARLPALEELRIERSDLTNEGAKAISKMKHLTYLDLSEAPIDSTFFREAPLPKTLTHLRLDQTNVDTKVLQWLPKTLTHLSLVATKIDKSAIPEFPQFDKLQVLRISGLSQAKLQIIRDALPNTKVNEEGFARF